MIEIYRKFDKNLIGELPRYTFNGRIVVIQSEGEARKAVAYLRRSKVLGLDTETRPSFRKGVHYEVSLLQISDGEICFLFRLHLMGFADCLVNLLEDPTILKIGLSLHDDFRMLSHRCEDFHPAGYVDLQNLSQGMGLEDLSLQKLFANFFHQRISKNEQLSNWEADCLTEKQRIYAATDAEACIRLYHIMSELHQSGDYSIIPPPPIEPVETAENPEAVNTAATATEVEPEPEPKRKRRARKPATESTTKKTGTAKKAATRPKAASAKSENKASKPRISKKNNSKTETNS